MKHIITLIITLFLLISYLLLSMATKKDIELPCENLVINILQEDSLVRAYYLTYSRDTVVIKAYLDSNWDQKTLQICNLMKDSCNQSGYKILVVDTTSNPAFFNSPYGKKIYFRQCQ